MKTIVLLPNQLQKRKTARYNQPSRVNQSLSIIPFFRAHTQYKLQRLVFSMCHFASFQSLPRGWAEEQLLPIWETWFDPLLHFMRSTSTQMSINTICVWKWKRGPWRFEAKKFLYSIWRKEKVAFFVSTLLSISLGYNFTNKPAQLASYHYVLEQMQRLTSAGSSDFSFDTWLTGGKKNL